MISAAEKFNQVLEGKRFVDMVTLGPAAQATLVYLSRKIVCFVS
jgi:hypothetical protein